MQQLMRHKSCAESNHIPHPTQTRNLDALPRSPALSFYNSPNALPTDDGFTGHGAARGHGAMHTTGVTKPC